MKKLLMVIVFGLAVMAGCSSGPTKSAQTEKAQPKLPELITGRSALFQKLYIAARGWQRDAQPYRLESQLTVDATGKDGKADVWRAGFASPAQRTSKPYLWSGTDAQDAPSRGVNPGTEDSYNSTNSSTHVFDVAFLKIDSDKAFEVAQLHGGNRVLEKAPDTPILYVLEWSTVTNELIWHVIYGRGRDDAKLRVAVNGSTGDFLRVEK